MQKHAIIDSISHKVEISSNNCNGIADIKSGFWIHKAILSRGENGNFEVEELTKIDDFLSSLPSKATRKNCARAEKRYWEVRPPYAWKPIKTREDYVAMRKLRYDLHDYMAGTFQFENFANKRVLEIGCGSGIDSAEFAKHGAEVYTVDLTKKATQTTKNLFNVLGFSKRVIRCSATALPFREEFFDVVYAFGVLHHIPNVENIINEIYRVLKVNGTILAMLYHKDSMQYHAIMFTRGVMQRYFSHMTEEKIFAKFSEYRQDCPYSKAYTIEEAKKLFKKFNVKVETHYNVYDYFDERKRKLVSVPDGSKVGFHLVLKGTKQVRSN